MNKGTLVELLEMIDNNDAKVVMADNEVEIGEIKVDIKSDGETTIKLCCKKEMTEQPSD